MTIEILEKRRKNNIECFLPWIGEIETDIIDVINSAERGNYKSMMYLYQLYCEGWYIPCNGYQTIFWFRQISDVKSKYRYESEFADIFYCIGLIHFLGDGLEKNLGKAIWWFKRAANLENSDAMYLLGQIYMHAKNKPEGIWFVRDDEIFKNFRAAFYWFKHCFKRCSADLRGKLYLYGIGIESDEEKSFELFVETVTSLNYSGKMYDLGKKYIYGEEKNFEKGIYWLKRAVDHLNDDAAIELSKIYFEGILTEININKASWWLRKITNLDELNVDFTKKIAEKYFCGKNVKKNVRNAIYWYKKLAEVGDIDSMYKLGEIYRYGQGVEKNLSEAVKWLDMAYQKMKR